MKAIQYKLENDLKKLEILKEIYADRQGWVVESENHVNVGDGHGLNKTAFAVKAPMSCACAVVFDTQEKAEKEGVNYYLVDGNNKPVYMKVVKASDFFNKAVESAKGLLLFIKQNIK